jgi:hypothetical protein
MWQLGIKLRQSPALPERAVESSFPISEDPDLPTVHTEVLIMSL